MEKNWLERTELLIKEDGLLALKNAHVLIVGLGGVGSFAAEFLTRAGVGKLTIVEEIAPEKSLVGAVCKIVFIA